MSSTAISPPEPLHIAEWTATSGPVPAPPHGCLALLLALDDAGTCHARTGVALACPAGTLLLLGPADRWQLDTQLPARLASLCFSLDYLATQTAGHPQATDWQLLHAHDTLGATGYLAATEVPPALAALLTLLVDCYAGRRGVARDALANSLAGTMLRTLGPLLAPAQPAPAATTHAASVVRQVLAYIRRHAAVPGRLHLGHLAQEFAYSPSHLSALFRQHMREPLHQYIMRHRLQLAENQLQASALTVSQIADELGFVDVCHLNKQFKKRYHLTPTEYRRQRGCHSPSGYA